jgi:glycine cleavage system transcriptional repressor
VAGNAIARECRAAWRLGPYPRRVRHLLVSALGRDRPGIVAALTGVLLQHGANLEDSQMTILRGHFAVMLIVAVPEDADTDSLSADLDAVAGELGLGALFLHDVAGVDATSPEPSHIVTVYGVDHPGIVHHATKVLAERAVDITDLNTRIVEEEGEETLYTLMMEVALPPSQNVDQLEEALAGVAKREQVEISLHELEQDVL